jgi:hypothetical protein
LFVFTTGGAHEDLDWGTAARSARSAGLDAVAAGVVMRYSNTRLGTG